MRLKTILLSALLMPLAGAWAAPLKIVTTTSDLAALAREVGGAGVQAEALAKPVQNPHFVDAKPSLIVKLMKADLFIQTGLELEQGWAPLLAQSSGNRNVQRGARGFLDASAAITPIEVPQNPTRLMGDVHPHGNPHYLMDPENGRLVARAIAAKLAELSPADAAAFRHNLAAFEAKLDARMNEWSAQMKPLAGVKYVGYHRDASYFAKRFELVHMGEIEPKPGVPPTSQHTAQLIERMRAEQVRLILTQPWYESKTPESIARQTGAKVFTLSTYPGAVPDADDYLSCVDRNVRGILEAMK